MSLYQLNVTVHLLAALLWLGGMFFLAVVGAPVLRAVEPPGLRARLFRELGLRFRTAGWWSIGVLVITGVLNLHFRGLLRAGVLGSADFWTSPYGNALAWKLVAVTVMLVVSFLHDFVIGPAASRAADGASVGAGEDTGHGEDGGHELATRRLRRRAAWLARVNAVFGLVLVWAAVRLARGG